MKFGVGENDHLSDRHTFVCYSNRLKSVIPSLAVFAFLSRIV